VRRRYGRVGPGLPIVLTEGGWSLAADDAVAGVHDPERTMYYANYTSELRRAVHGAPQPRPTIVESL
jgi:hypothetical protein